MPSLSANCVYDIDCVDLFGKPLPLRQFAGQPMLIVNTASLCGFSPQFKELESIWQENKDKGLIVLGVPSNDFGHQEPGSISQIISLCTTKFNITFPLLMKTSVKGQDRHPLFELLDREGGFLSKPRWNFYKYVIGRDGHLHDWFSSLANPGSPRVMRALREVIGTDPA